MKNCITCLIVATCVAITSSAEAFQLKELVGRWKGKRTELRNGEGIYSSAKMVGRERSQGGFVIVETGTSKWLGPFRMTYTFAANGRFRLLQSYHGRVISSGSGRWKLIKNGVFISGVQKSESINWVLKGSIKMPTEKKVIYRGKAGDFSLRISAHRISRSRGGKSD